MLNGFLIGPFQNSLQITRIVVIENAEFSPGKSGRIHDAGVDKLVEDDDVILVEQRGNGAHCGGVAGGKGQRCSGFLEVGEGFLQFVKGGERAADQPRGPGRGSHWKQSSDTSGRSKSCVARRQNPHGAVRETVFVRVAPPAASSSPRQKKAPGNLRFAVCGLRAKRRARARRWGWSAGSGKRRPSRSMMPKCLRKPLHGASPP